MEHKILLEQVLSGERRALAQAITLIESTRSDHRSVARELVKDALQAERKALRIGLSGTPGVGKSTFIESFGMFLVQQGLKVAVLAVDPSSVRSGGSILGDKTRMEQLSREKNAFIRPSPSKTELGGVARRTREAIILCEAAGYDVVLVETVGVGQSETIVADMTDIFVLLLAPAGGDELQGVKRGIMEIADIIFVNKADGELKSTAMRTCADYSGALRLMRKRSHDPDGFPKALCISSIENTGLEQAWSEISTLIDARKSNGYFGENRSRQALKWFEEELQNKVSSILIDNPIVAVKLPKLQQLLLAGELTPDEAVQQIVVLFTNNLSESLDPRHLSA